MKPTSVPGFQHNKCLMLYLMHEQLREQYCHLEYL